MRWKECFGSQASFLVFFPFFLSCNIPVWLISRSLRLTNSSFYRICCVPSGVSLLLNLSTCWTFHIIGFLCILFQESYCFKSLQTQLILTFPLLWSNCKLSFTFQLQSFQMDLHEVAQRIENNSPPAEIFRSLVESTESLHHSGSTDQSLVDELCSAEGLANVSSCIHNLSLIFL